ncbi:isomerase [Streptomyces sp. ISL-43]|uniref:5-carboxymethyl-2-hydroxymuconate Delta-isomerase n=1 Tax=Streptomyces sp. ISL-43 TaxID=2819183 RepID=UPI001BE5914E|nr:isomerase [Streptomyces sp. ISL-43]MBT2448730.1 isomerase [Streptomyces sp. ISL-43]
MPQITVDYSANLSEAFDRRGFALALHPLTAELADTSVETCKTRFRCVEEVYVADGAPENGLVHVQVGLLAGRTEAVKAELSEAVLALLPKYTSTGANAPGVVVHASVDVSELGAAYRKRVGA